MKISSFFFARYEGECAVCRRRILVDERIHSWYTDYAHAKCYEYGLRELKTFRKNLPYILGTIFLVLFLAYCFPNLLPYTIVLWVVAAYFLLGHGATDGLPSEEVVRSDRSLIHF